MIEHINTIILMLIVSQQIRAPQENKKGIYLKVLHTGNKHRRIHTHTHAQTDTHSGQYRLGGG